MLSKKVLNALIVSSLICAAGAAIGAEDPNQVTASLLGDPAVASAMRDIESMQTGLLDDLIELTEIPAPPFGEQARAARFAEKLREEILAPVDHRHFVFTIGYIHFPRPPDLTTWLWAEQYSLS